MAEPRTLPISAEHREFTVKANGQALPRTVQLLAASVVKAANRVAAARLAFADGSAAVGDFPLQNTDLLTPGAEVEVLAGPGDKPVSLFKGVVVSHRVKVRERAPAQLVVECRHKAVKLTVGRRGAYYADQTDADAISALLDRAKIQADVEATKVKHQQLVQYDCTDWDFLVLRATANGKLVFTNAAAVEVRAPKFDGTPACTLQFGATLLEFDAEIDARHQFAGVTAESWDPAEQKTATHDAADPAAKTPGNFKPDQLAGVVGLDHETLRTPTADAGEAQAWADAERLRSQMGKVNGRAKCEGIGTVNPGDVVTLAGLGGRLNGTAYVSAVRHEFDTVQGWKTHVQFGAPDRLPTGGGDADSGGSGAAVSAPRAAALLPAANGLQIGVVVSNEDPDGEHRVRVRLPLVDAAADGAWARVAAPDAGKDRGFFFRPEVGDEVVVGFLNDDPRHAVVVGMLHSSANPAPLKGSDRNDEKAYQSRSKLRWHLDDQKKEMRFETPAGNKVVLSEQDKSVQIEDQNGNKITLGPDGITIQSAKALTVKAKTELTLQSGTSLSAEGGTNLKLQGKSGAELSSTSTTAVKGTLVQLN